MATMETWKRQILSHNSNGCKEEKMLLQKHESYIFKLPVEKRVYWISARQKKNVSIWKLYILRKKEQKLKNKTVLYFMTTFHNFVLKV